MAPRGLEAKWFWLRAWMQRRDKQVILIQCNTFSELHRVPDTMVYNPHNNPRWWGGGRPESALCKFEPEVGPLPSHACGSNCRLDKGEAEDRRGSRASNRPLSGIRPGPKRITTRGCPVTALPHFFTLKPGPQSLPPGTAAVPAAHPLGCPHAQSQGGCSHLPGSGRSGTHPSPENGLDFKFPVPFHFTEGSIRPQRMNRLS